MAVISIIRTLFSCLASNLSCKVDIVIIRSDQFGRKVTVCVQDTTTHPIVARTIFSPGPSNGDRIEAATKQGQRRRDPTLRPLSTTVQVRKTQIAWRPHGRYKFAPATPALNSWFVLFSNAVDIYGEALMGWKLMIVHWWLAFLVAGSTRGIHQMACISVAVGANMHSVGFATNEIQLITIPQTWCYLRNVFRKRFKIRLFGRFVKAPISEWVL